MAVSQSTDASLPGGEKKGGRSQIGGRGESATGALEPKQNGGTDRGWNRSLMAEASCLILSCRMIQMRMQILLSIDNAESCVLSGYIWPFMISSNTPTFLSRFKHRLGSRNWIILTLSRRRKSWRKKPWISCFAKRSPNDGRGVYLIPTSLAKSPGLGMTNG